MTILQQYLAKETLNEKFIFISFLNKENQEALLKELQKKEAREYRKIMGKINAAEQEQSLYEKIDEKGQIELDKLKLNPFQPRTVFDPQKIQTLADSIREQGQITPILITKKDDNYIIIAGERRYRAMKLLQQINPKKYKTIDVKIIKDADNNKLKILALLENIHRENLSIYEEAQTYKEFNKTMTIEQITDITKKSKTKIGRLIKIAKLPKKVLEVAKEYNISSIVFLEELSKQKDIDLMLMMVKEYGKGEKAIKEIIPSVSKKEDTVNDLKQEKENVVKEDENATQSDCKIQSDNNDNFSSEEKTTENATQNKQELTEEEFEKELNKLIINFNEKIITLEEKFGMITNAKVVISKK